MGLWDKLKQATQSRGRGSYFQYKGKRDHDRKQAEREREFAKDAAEQQGVEAERERGYEERYARERERKTGSE
jgi:GAF domain-containing protein